jgi:ATP/maltotriose-dependent transcriptional regulator MalT
MNDAAVQSNADRYEQVVDLVFAICGGDLRSALRALVIANEYLKRELTEACSALSLGEQASSLADTHQTFLDQESEIGALLRSLQDNAERAGRLSELLSDTRPETGQMSSGIASLSPREHSVLELIAQGQSNKEIARELGIAPETVKSHVKNIFIKLGVDKRAKAVARATTIARNASYRRATDQLPPLASARNETASELGISATSLAEEL